MTLQLSLPGDAKLITTIQFEVIRNVTPLQMKAKTNLSFLQLYDLALSDMI